MATTYAMQIEEILASGQRYLSDDLLNPACPAARDTEEYDDQGASPELCFDE
ncbi:hypothetical protein [Tatumella sp. JGM118]|uniref:Uncharacterized protein n=1 Tax=Tatumella terrea TaxID=419007 RepID=A0ABW1VTL4_9GAMM|nr:hypothetical protein [Tatumella sp. JGM118]MBS0909585.1 hypothetical protein [Tatumella sp. JGM118]